MAGQRYVRMIVFPVVAAVVGLVVSVAVAWRSTHELSDSTATTTTSSVAAPTPTTSTPERPSSTVVDGVASTSTTSPAAGPTSTDAATTTTARTPSPVPDVTIGVVADVLSANQNARAGRSAAGLQAFADVLPSAYLPDPTGAAVQNRDLLDHVSVSASEPFQVTYAVNRSARWSDGIPIGCSDFYLAWMAGRGDVDKDGNQLFDAASTLGYADIGAITCSPDGRDTTVRFLRPNGRWPFLFSYLVPAHLVTAAARVKDLVALDRKPDAAALTRLGAAWASLFVFDKVLPKAALVGGGPFVVSEWKAKSRLVLTRNPAWWGVPARLQRVVFQVLADPTKQLAALKAGQVQVVTGPNDPALLGSPDPTTARVTTGGAAALDQVVFNLRNPFLQNRAIRRALARCVPRRAIVADLAAKGLAAESVPGSFLNTPDQRAYQDESAALTVVDDAQIADELSKAGWTKGADGLLQNSDRPVTLRVLGDGGPRSTLSVPKIIEACRALGFDLVVDPIRADHDARITSGDFDLALLNLAVRPDPAAARSRYDAAGVDNVGSYVSATVTAQFAQLSTVLDPTERGRVTGAIDQQLWQDVPSVPLDQPLTRATYRPNVDGVVRNPHGPGLAWNLTEWIVR